MLIPKFYSLSNIQDLAFALHERAAYFDSLVSGESPNVLTPSLLLDAFQGLQKQYEYLEDSVGRVESSIECGHDPHRELLYPSEFSSDSFDEIIYLDTVSSFPL